MTDETKTEERPSASELAKFVSDIARKAGFEFKAQGDQPLARLPTPDHFYWHIEGKLPINFRLLGIRDLEIKTRDVNCENSLRETLGGGSNVRYYHSTITLRLPKGLVRIEEDNGYFERVIIDEGKSDRISVDSRHDDRAKNACEMIDEAREIAKREYGCLLDILTHPYHVALINYSNAEVHAQIESEIELLRSSSGIRGLVNRVINPLSEKPQIKPTISVALSSEAPRKKGFLASLLSKIGYGTS